MAVAFVKNHPVASNKTSGTTLDVTLSTDVPAGNLIVLYILYDNAATAFKPVVSSVTRPAGEVTVWGGFTFTGSGSTSAGAFVSGAMNAILASVVWPAGSYTVTLDTATVQKAAFFQEFSGATADEGTTVAQAIYSTTTTAASATNAGGPPAVGDLALGFIFGSNVAAAQAGDTDTTGGSWSTPVGVGTTGGSGTTNNYGIVQYKILTSAANQTVNNSAAMTAGNGAIVMIVRQAPVVTQAAYRWFDEGTESGSVALADQNTPATGDITVNDGIGQLRVRLQSTNATLVPSTDDWQLQWEKNSSGTWTNVGSDAVLGYNSPNLTDGAATTNRLGAGTGSFVAGKLSEDGLVDNAGWSGNNYTELLWSLALLKDNLANGDTLRFRVLRNGATTGLTYTQTPTINIVAAAVPVSGTATGTIILAGAAAGQKDITGTAAGSVDVAGAAAGVAAPASNAVTGTAVGSLAVTGVASGQVTTVGLATGTLAVAGTAVGQVITTGQATGTLTLGGTAAGQKTVTATATGQLQVAGTASGLKAGAGNGSAVGSLTVTGLAAGVRTTRGVATGSVALGSTTVGQVTVTATATGSLSFAGSASGVKTVRGLATGQVVLGAVALGQVEGNAVGRAAGNLTVTGLATGRRGRPGTATGQLTLTGLANGTRGRPGTATGTLSLVGLSIGRVNRPVTGHAAGVLTLEGLVLGRRSTTGTAAGQVVFVGTARGSGPEVTIGMWDGAEFVLMQYEHSEVVDWILTPA